MRTAAIVLAAGSGRRMQSEIPKQYLPLAGMPVVCHSLKTFAEAGVDEIVLVCAAESIEWVREAIVKAYGCERVTAIVAGGAERYHSVYAGLTACPDADLVLVHDGARPLITAQIVRDLIEKTKVHGACVSGMPAKDTIKKTDASGVVEETPDRSRLWVVHTPQAFEGNLLRTAYEALFIDEKPPKVTDDAMVVEHYTSVPVHMVSGSYENIKVTTPEDMIIAEAFLAARAKA